MVVFFLPLFGHHSRVVFCQKEKKSQTRTNRLATRSNLGSERRTQNATKGPVRRHTISCLKQVQGWGQTECGVSAHQPSP